MRRSGSEKREFIEIIDQDLLRIINPVTQFGFSFILRFGHSNIRAEENYYTSLLLLVRVRATTNNSLRLLKRGVVRTRGCSY